MLYLCTFLGRLASITATACGKSQEIIGELAGVFQRDKVASIVIDFFFNVRNAGFEFFDISIYAKYAVVFAGEKQKCSAH